MSRLTSTTRHLRAGGAAAGAVTGQAITHYAYDGNGNLVRSTDPNGNATRFSYDALDRLIGITYADGMSEAFAYDRAHNLSLRTDANGSAMTYRYDALNRGVQADIVRAAGVAGSAAAGRRLRRPLPTDTGDRQQRPR